MDEVTGKTLVLGIGNLLWADEGFGVRCVEALAQRYVLPDTVVVMDGGTQGLYLLPAVTAARRLIVFDAVDYGLPPATLQLVRDDEIPRYLGIRKMSLHQSSFQEVLSLAMLGGRYPRQMLLVGVQPEEISDYGGSLRASVKARVPEAVDIALRTLAAWGIEAVPRAAAEAPTLTQACIALGAYESGRPSEAVACRLGDARVLAAGGHG